MTIFHPKPKVEKLLLKKHYSQRLNQKTKEKELSLF